MFNHWRTCFRRRKLYGIPSLLREINREVRAAYDTFSGDQELSRDPSEWLLDNYYVVRRAITQVSEDITFSFHRRLPLQAGADDRDETRIFLLSRKFTSRRESLISISGTASFLRQYQKKTYLTTAELWALPAMLRLAVLLDLAGELHSMMNQGGDGAGVSTAILNLRKIEETDWKTFFEKVSPVEKILRGDPAGIYREMDFATRDEYRKSVEKFSRKHGVKETETARAAVALSADAAPGSIESHTGWYLVFPRGRSLLEKRMNLSPGPGTPGEKTRSILFIGAVVFWTMVFTGLFLLSASGNGISDWALAALVLIPSAALAVELVFQGALLFSSTGRLLKMDFSKGIPRHSRTIVVIPSILSSQAEAEDLLEQIERHYLGNGGENTLFGLLTDLRDSAEKHSPGDERILALLRKGISRLNLLHSKDGSQVFYLFHRERRWNPSEKVWMGWERKRGKLEEFNRLLLAAGETSFIDGPVPEGVRFVVTLDSDTIISGGTVAVMAGAMAHPLNSYSGKTGYSVMQPRTLPLFRDGKPTPFFRAFSGDFSVDLYSTAVSDAYQDLFGEGIYMGKGIYDLRAFHRTAGSKVPENSLLSHDMLEGLLGRAGYLSDVVVYEEFPENYGEWLKRQHRWIRGDWQLLPWLFRREFSLLDRWKIADNMRRSLTEPALLVFLLAGWFLSDGSLTLPWTVLAAAVLFRSQLLQWLFNGFRIRGSAFLRGFLDTALLPLNSACNLHAVILTLYRVLISRRNLLKWTSAAAVARSTPSGTGKRAYAVSLFSAGLFTALVAVRGEVPLSSIPFLLSWAALPLLMGLVSTSAGKPLSSEDVSTDTGRLLKTAMRTWYFFDVFVGPEDHWLPPDHYQEEPLDTVAHRTSPTNIGLFLLSVLAAGDLGFTGIRQLLLRIEDTLEGVGKLSKYRGHLLNWHNTKTLEPLKPAYVSTVDSGNLLAALVTLKQGMDDSSELSPVSAERWQGLSVMISLLEEALGETEGSGNELLDVLEQTRTIISEGDSGTGTLIDLCKRQLSQMDGMFLELMETEGSRFSRETLGELRAWSERLRDHLSAMLDEIESLYPWLLQIESEQSLALGTSPHPQVREAWARLREAVPEKPSPALMTDRSENILKLLASLCSTVKDLVPGDEGAWLRGWIGNLEDSVEESRDRCLEILDDIDRIKGIIDSQASAMDFSFLYNSRRRVFRIGFNVDAEQPDANCYDLLASEARLASLLAVARRQVPFEHWLHLSRPFTTVSGMIGLLSWSGTMFEYLMPLIFTGYRSETLLGISCAAAIRKQIEYGRAKGLPWGVSESGYYWFDQSRQYQYKAFGVPGLGYKRGLEDDSVVAPYASILALPAAPQRVVENLIELDELGMTGRYGYYEAVDFTDERLPAGKAFRRVMSYMAHHQGMILLSIQNHLLDEVNVKRFHRDPEVSTVELLLHESVPGNPRITYARPRPAKVEKRERLQTHLESWRIERNTPATVAHCISNGTLGAVVTDNGATFSSWKGMDLSNRDTPGERVLIKNLETGALRDSCKGASAVWHPHKAEFLLKFSDLTVLTEIIAAPDFDGTLRRITLTSHCKKERRYFLCFLAEPALAEPVEYTRHPEFNRLFLSTGFAAEHGMLVVSRRKRSPGEQGAAAGVFIPGEKKILFESDREAVTGRGGSAVEPEGLLGTLGFTGRTGTTVDPVMALGTEISLSPEESRTVSFALLCAEDQGELHNAADMCSNRESVDNAFRRSEVFTRRELSSWGLDSELLKRMQPVFSSLAFPSWRLRSQGSILSCNELGQNSLWRFGISGDLPVLLVTADTGENLDLVRDLLRIQQLWRGRGFNSDLVLLNMEPAGYDNELQGKLRRLLTSTGSEKWEGRRGGVFLLNRGLIDDSEEILLKTWASVVLNCSRDLENQTALFFDEPVRQPDLVPVPVEEEVESFAPVAPPEDLLFHNGYGGFTPDGREYVIYLEEGRWLPRPWINVMANEKAGLTVSESGIECLWALNSGENRLLPWRNDPVEDAPGMAVYCRDEETGEFWSPTPLPVRDSNPYLVRHSAGYTVWEHTCRGLAQRMTVFTDAEDPAAAVNISIENLGKRNRRIGVTVYAEPVLGASRRASSRFLISGFNTSCNAILTRNTAAEKPPAGVFFLASSRTPNGITTDRREFLGKNGTLKYPAAMRRTGLSGGIRPGLDPCAAIQVMIWIGPGERKEVTFLTGQETSPGKASELIRSKMIKASGGAMLRATTDRWDSLLGGITIETPDRAMDLMVNRWLLYQTLSCRIFGRTALYQSSGAFGFRDQLQDCLALSATHGDIPGKHILMSASKQFVQGDVLHWWHPPRNAGVKTRCSDDLLWLPYAVAEYVRKTGDRSILEETIPFLGGGDLSEEENERYDRFPVSAESGTLHEHCMKALKKGLTKGPHGIPLMGSHDWNDGMSLVGEQGRGESVWLGWFLYKTLVSYSSLCNENERNLLLGEADTLKRALNEGSWDGNWYLRAFYDDGHPLGGRGNRECMIASIAQSWAVLSGAGDQEKSRMAMDSVLEYLVDRETGTVNLFTPPFDRTSRHPGYIMGYPPGVRENGGQYTHAAVWVAWALASTGRGSAAMEIFSMLNPVNKSFPAHRADTYRVEPYAVAADVYSSSECPGRGGWTWYTGAAGWMYRLATEALLGINLEGNSLLINPCIPEYWKEWRVTLRISGCRWSISFINPDSVASGVAGIEVNKVKIKGNRIDLSEGSGDNIVQVTMGKTVL